MKGRRTQKKSKTPVSRRTKKAGGLWTWKTAAGLGMLVICLAVGYLAQIGDVSDKSHRIRALENEVAELKEQRDELELRIAEERSMQVVEARVRELGMVPAENVEYLTPTEPVVAKR